MKKLIIASAIVFAATGMAAAESNRLYGGNYSASVLDQYGAPGVIAASASGTGLDRMATASVTAPIAAQAPGVEGNYAANVTRFEIASGR